MNGNLPKLLLYVSFMFLGTGTLFFLVNKIPVSKKNPTADLGDPTRPISLASPYLIAIGIVLLTLSGLTALISN